ncbi:MAG: hypothetical protein DRJ01_10345 [Bacteroidetes bacterium]|nr:MAG: hypothetical protein DRJ01_10345 [Bacteroidota bacterium]
MKLRRLNNILHRDLGYFFAGMIIIYSLSGIALNHLDDWNPDLKITKQEITVNLPENSSSINKQDVEKILTDIGEIDNYKKFYFPEKDKLKIFLKVPHGSGSVNIDLKSGNAYIEKLSRRPVFNQINFLHRNNARKMWTWYADIFALSLMILAISGLFILKGKNGIKGRGAWLTILGILIPLIMLLLYY